MTITRRLLRVSTVVVFVALSACGGGPKAPVLTAERMDGFSFTNQVAYQSIDTLMQRGDTLIVELGVTAVPIQSEMLRTASWQAKVWRVDRGTARLVHVTSKALDAPVSFALP